jgi:hypothetical protein
MFEYQAGWYESGAIIELIELCAVTVASGIRSDVLDLVVLGTLRQPGQSSPLKVET